MSDYMFDPPFSIKRIREDHVANVLPEYASTPAHFRVFRLPGHSSQNHAADIQVYADGSVISCKCHPPIVEGDLILGLQVREEDINE